MTCIVGLASGGDVWIGGDSISTNGHDVDLGLHPKVFRNGPFLIGFAGSWRMGQLLQYTFSPPQHHPDTDAFAYMVTSFMGAVRQCFADAGFVWNDEGNRDRRFMIGYKGRLFIAQSDCAVLEWTSGAGSLGSASEYAMGAVYATQGQDSRARILTALRCAEDLTSGVRGPFTIEVLEG